jgi:uncharacterized RDD family membrane protein YckC
MTGEPGRVGGPAVAFAYTGERYLLGYGADFFGIWERPGRGGPERTFPRSDEGWAAAWLAYRSLEPNAARVASAVAPKGIAGEPLEDPSLAPGESSMVLATPGSRLLARVVDGLLLGAVVLALLAATGRYPTDTSADALSAALPGVWWLLGLSAAYEVTLVAVRGQTLGKMAFHIRVAALPDGGAPGAGRSVLRWVVPVVMNVVPFLGLLAFVPILFDPLRQGLHDKTAGTVVVSTRGVRRAPEPPS